jgi:uncharacterized membrane protein
MSDHSDIHHEDFDKIVSIIKRARDDRHAPLNLLAVEVLDVARVYANRQAVLYAYKKGRILEAEYSVTTLNAGASLDGRSESLKELDILESYADELIAETRWLKAEYEKEVK